ncbi:MAG: hypothetical protein PUD92_02155 [Clostridiales bacterium]|nr:hypothetical protein [Clostridiales bacterium]
MKRLATVTMGVLGARCDAPLKRNDAMVELADMVPVIWDGISRGSKHTIDYAKKLNKEVRVITPEK